MTTDSRTTFTPNLVIGLGIALLGIVLILDRVGIMAARDLLRFWPVLLILFGASVVAQALRGGADQPRQRPMVSPGFILFVVIASVFFSNTYQRAGATQRTTSTETLSQFNVMSRSDQTSTAARFQGADITNVMGAANLDLRDAMIPPGGEAVIDIFSVMGKVELIIPDGWTVEVQAAPIMGAVRDRRFRSSLRIDDQRLEAGAAEAATPVERNAPPPRVVLRGFVMMGAVVVRS
ncbi:MAG TPA: LiaF domain-containing protein [Vicinamibacterales bacterium]|nr:LiaF domain-containing protein [Vicinamibacterales bacterium]